jgi:hypothetical protein
MLPNVGTPGPNFALWAGKKCLCAAFLLNEWKQKDFVERAAAVLLNEPVSKCVCVEPLRTRLS